MPETITREQLNDAIEEFANKIMEALGATTADEETSEPELTGTYFKVRNLNGDEIEVDAVDVSSGTVIADGAFEYFRCYAHEGTGPWVRYNGASYSHEQFASEMRDTLIMPRIVHYG